MAKAPTVPTPAPASYEAALQELEQLAAAMSDEINQLRQGGPAA